MSHFKSTGIGLLAMLGFLASVPIEAETFATPNGSLPDGRDRQRKTIECCQGVEQRFVSGVFSVDGPLLTRNALVTIEFQLASERIDEIHPSAQEVQTRNVP